MSEALEGMARAGWNVQTSRGVADFDAGDEAFRGHMKAEMKAALLWLADRMEENGELTTDCKRAAVSAYLSTGQNGRGMVEPVRLMKAISAALRAATGEATP